MSVASSTTAVHLSESPSRYQGLNRTSPATRPNERGTVSATINVRERVADPEYRGKLTWNGILCFKYTQFPKEASG